MARDPAGDMIQECQVLDRYNYPVTLGQDGKWEGEHQQYNVWSIIQNKWVEQQLKWRQNKW